MNIAADWLSERLALWSVCCSQAGQGVLGSPATDSLSSRFNWSELARMPSGCPPCAANRPRTSTAI